MALVHSKDFSEAPGAFTDELNKLHPDSGLGFFSGGGTEPLLQPEGVKTFAWTFTSEWLARIKSVPEGKHPRTVDEFIRLATTPWRVPLPLVPLGVLLEGYLYLYPNETLPPSCSLERISRVTNIQGRKAAAYQDSEHQTLFGKRPAAQDEGGMPRSEFWFDTCREYLDESFEHLALDCAFLKDCPSLEKVWEYLRLQYGSLCVKMIETASLLELV